jgi:DNA/RNA endonuclease YhcR with UshA esterase domain
MDSSTFFDRTRRGLRVLALAVIGTGAAACAEDPADPYEISGTGGVEGFLYFDSNRDGVFDPSAGDEVVSGVQVAVRNRGTTENYATATSDASGRFGVESIPPGTHDLYMVEASIPDGVDFCQNPVPVSVYIGEPAFKDVAGLNGCVIAIAEAKEFDPNAGEFITIKGIVTSAPGQVDGTFTWIQDSSGGIQVFGSSLVGQGIEIGDRIEISGTLAQFGTQLQVSSPVLNALEKGVGALAPALTTTGAISAAGPLPKDFLQGLLVKVEKAELVVAFGDGQNIQNGTINDGSGSATIRIDDGVYDRNELNSLMTVGKCYDIIGMIGNFNGEGQVFPRDADEIVEVPCA